VSEQPGERPRSGDLDELRLTERASEAIAVDLSFTDEEVAFAAEIRAWLAENLELPPAFDSFDDEIAWGRKWQAKLAADRWVGIHWPAEYGGRSASPVQVAIYNLEYGRSRAMQLVNRAGINLAGPTLLAHGTEEQKANWLPSILNADEIWCQLFSEPEAGSDLASLRTTATPVEGGWVLNGQKVWTSYAQVAAKCCCYVRTDPDVPKHKGISLLIVDMDTPGIDVRPLRHLSGAANFAEVFFTDVEVPAENLVGGLNDGWRITQGSLAHERAGLWVEGVCRLESTINGLIAIAQRRGLDDDAGVRRRIAAIYEQAASLRALGYKGFASFAQGSSAPEHSYMKMATSELGKTAYELGMQLQGAYGAVHDDERGEERGRWVDLFFLGFANTVAGGTSEIQRNIIAQRVLVLPRT
jgi:alkylation response protein AidB-like acyl-CoA dehydrogenase